MSLLAVRGGCLRNVRGVGMMQMLMRQPAVDGTVKVVSAATATATAAA